MPKIPGLEPGETPDASELEKSPEVLRLAKIKAVVLEKLGTAREGEEEQNDELARKYAQDIANVDGLKIPENTEYDELYDNLMALVGTELKKADWFNPAVIADTILHLPEIYPKHRRMKEHEILLANMRENNEELIRVVQLIMLRNAVKARINIGWHVPDVTQPGALAHLAATMISFHIEANGLVGIPETSLTAGDVLSIVRSGYGLPENWSELSPEIQEEIVNGMRAVVEKYTEALEFIDSDTMPEIRRKTNDEN